MEDKSETKVIRSEAEEKLDLKGDYKNFVILFLLWNEISHTTKFKPRLHFIRRTF